MYYSNIVLKTQSPLGIIILLPSEVPDTSIVSEGAVSVTSSDVVALLPGLE